MQQAGVALHAITAEAGGDEEIKKRLADRNTVLSYPVHGDPEHHLLVRRKTGSGTPPTPGSLSVDEIKPDPKAEEPSEEAKAELRASLEDYFGTPLQDLRSTTEEEEAASAPEGDENDSLYVMKKYDASKHGGTYQDYMMIQPALIVVDKTGKIQQVWSWNTPPLDVVSPKEELVAVQSHGGLVLVGVRPLTPDILPSIKENRNVKLSGKTKFQIGAEMLAGMKDGSMSKSMGRLMKAMGA